MRRYSWTKHTMVVAEVGGAYVTFHDHQRAMDAKDAEIAELRAMIFPKRCANCEAKGPHAHCFHGERSIATTVPGITTDEMNKLKDGFIQRLTRNGHFKCKILDEAHRVGAPFRMYDVQTECPCCKNGVKGWLFKSTCDFCKGTGLWPRKPKE